MVLLLQLFCRLIVNINNVSFPFPHFLQRLEAVVVVKTGQWEFWSLFVFCLCKDV